MTTRRRRSSTATPVRRIVQITASTLTGTDRTPTLVRTALCDDGTLWELMGTTWRALPPIPTTTVEANTGRRPDGSGVERICHFCRDKTGKLTKDDGCLVCFNTGTISADESDRDAEERAHCIPCDGHGFIGTEATPCIPCEGSGFRIPPSKREKTMTAESTT